MTAALEEGMSGQQHAPAALYPRERPGIHFIIFGTRAYPNSLQQLQFTAVTVGTTDHQTN